MSFYGETLSTNLLLSHSNVQRLKNYAQNFSFFSNTGSQCSLSEKFEKRVRKRVARERNLRKVRNFWANFTDFEPEINIGPFHYIRTK